MTFWKSLKTKITATLPMRGVHGTLPGTRATMRPPGALGGQVGAARVPRATLPFGQGRRLAMLILGILSTGVVLGGCNGKPKQAENPAETPAKQHTTRVLVVGDAPLAQAISRQWTAHFNRPLRVLELATDQLASARQLAADIVVYPSALLGTLAERKLIQPLQQETLNAPQLAIRDVVGLQRRAEVLWGERVYAVSFGSPQLVLFYRKDLFERLKLKPPRTWQEYQSVAARLRRDSLGDAAPRPDQPWSATIEPMQGPWAAKLLLARAAAYARHPSQFSTLFDYSTMDPLIDGPPFQRALKELVAARKSGPGDADHVNPRIAKQRFLAGQAGMALAWPSRAAAGAPAKNLDAKQLQIGFVQLPGAHEMYDCGEKAWATRKPDEPLSIPLLAVAGRLGSVTQEAPYPHEAGQVLAWLAGKKWSPLVAPVSAATTLYRKSHLEKPAIWSDAALTAEASREYAEVVIDTQSRPAHMTCPRIPGRERYLAALSQAVQEACGGAATPDAALAQVADQWRKITAELGHDTQQAAYARSLGLEP